jgi:hypothetical protein
MTETSPEQEPKLTPKQQAFVHGVIEGKTATDAYRTAYNCEKMSKGAIAVEASRLLRHPKIALYLLSYRRIAADAAQATLEKHLAELARVREEAVASGQISAAVQAEYQRGKVAGFYNDELKLEVGLSDAKLLKQIEELMGEDIAEAIGAALKGSNLD